MNFQILRFILTCHREQKPLGQYGGCHIDPTRIELFSESVVNIFITFLFPWIFNKFRTVVVLTVTNGQEIIRRKK